MQNGMLLPQIKLDYTSGTSLGTYEVYNHIARAPKTRGPKYLCVST